MRIQFFRTTMVLILAAFVSLSVSAQSQMFRKGDKDLSIGVGFGSPLVIPGNYTIIPPIAFTFDYGLRDDWGPGVFGVGAYIGSSVYRSKNFNPFTGDKYGYNYTSFVIASRASYHYTFVDRLDTYGGAILGFRFLANSKYGDWSNVPNYSPDSKFPIVASGYVGVKYYFTDNFAAYSELTTDIAYFTIGATFKF